MFERLIAKDYNDFLTAYRNPRRRMQALHIWDTIPKEKKKALYNEMNLPQIVLDIVAFFDGELVEF